MSFVKGKIGFSILRISADIPSFDVMMSRASTMRWGPLSSHEIHRQAIVTPTDEIPEDFEKPFIPLVEGDCFMFDLLTTERVPDSRVVARKYKKASIDENKIRKIMQNPVMDDQDIVDLKERIYEEEALKVSPKHRRISALIHIPTKTLLVSARRGPALDELLSIIGNTLIQDDETFISDRISSAWEASKKSNISAFGITKEQSTPPIDRTQWMAEFATWITATAIVGDDGMRTDDKMKVVYSTGKTISMTDINDGSVQLFGVQSMRGGALIKESSVVLATRCFETGAPYTNITISSSGYISGIDPGVKGAARAKHVSSTARGCVKVSNIIAGLADMFLELRKSPQNWGNESVRLRKMLSDNKQSFNIRKEKTGIIK